MPELDLPATKRAPSDKTLGVLPVLPVLVWTRLLALGGSANLAVYNARTVDLL
jgi:hypothetical protein